MTTPIDTKRLRRIAHAVSIESGREAGQIIAGAADHIDAQAAEIAGARQTIERWKARLADAKRDLDALKRDISDYIRIGNEQGLEITRLRDGIEEAIRLLGLDRPIDPTDTLRAALSGECHE